MAFARMGAGFGRMLNPLGRVGAAPFPLAGAILDVDFTTSRIFGASFITDVMTGGAAQAAWIPNAAGLLTQRNASVLPISSGGLYQRASTVNRVPRSEDFAQAVWVAANGAAKVGIAPVYPPVADPGYAGVAYELSFGATGGAVASAGSVSQSAIPGIQAGVNSQSLYVMAKTGTTTIRLAVTDSAAATTVTSDLTVTSTGWTRLSNIATLAAGNTQFWIVNNTAGNSGNVYVFGGQLELSPYPKAYVTTGSTSTARGADVNNLIGAALTAGTAASATVLVRTGLAPVSNPGIFMTNAAFSVRYMGSIGGNLVQSRVGGISLNATAGSGNFNTDKMNCMLAWSPSGRSLSLNGGVATSDANPITGVADVVLGMNDAFVERLTIW